MATCPTMKTVDSSMIRSAGYASEQEQLFVEFANGDTWRYDDVSQDEYSALMNADSQGKYFLSQIRPNKTGKKL